MKYDYLIVGSGLFGATFAHFAAKAGKRCLAIDNQSQRIADSAREVIHQSFSQEAFIKIVKQTI